MKVLVPCAPPSPCPGESGKSTILKQMKIIHDEGAEAGAGLSEADKRAQVRTTW